MTSQRLQDLVTRQADHRPDATAVVLDDARLTYGELDAQSTQLARLLRNAGCRRGDRICWLGPKSPVAIVVLLGIYKADCLYVPLDKRSPARRLKQILDSCEPRCVLAGGAAAERLNELACMGALKAPIRLGWMQGGVTNDHAFTIDFTAEDARGYPTAPLQSANSSQGPAHILFTSGSTGAPKGVVITHAAVIRFIAWAIDYFSITASDRHSGHSPLHFDLSMFDIFGTLASGAELHLVPRGLDILPNRVAEFIRAQRLTQWFSVPSLLAYMAKFDVVRQNDFPDLRRLVWCGEVFPTPTLVHWMQRLPHVTFTNLYAPTETTIASSFYTLPACPTDPLSAVPIGAACDGEELVVLDAEGRPAAPEEIGELHIGGAGLSPGYWRDQVKTRAAFVPDPRASGAGRLYRTGDLARLGNDGLVYFVGRGDTQIKSRGHRIELGEIETAMNALAFVQECAVIAVPTVGFEGTAIGCAYVKMPGARVTPMILRNSLSAVLPGYMLPSVWLPLETLPKNANHKIDRPKLREEFLYRAAQAS
ncbi:MAG: amino acid adenylation domain-containing protein [Acidobacteria bacterium]|nr:amino acid adenylation domain-containing protein [Acidobacteriota bacterium]